MQIEEHATRQRWQIPNVTSPGADITINGWDFGGPAEGGIALLHHANGMCAALWAPVARLLTEHYRVIAIDARGHGDSDAPEVPDNYPWSAFVADLTTVAERICESVGVDQIRRGIGSSFGGIVTAAAEARTPGLFHQITMLDPPIHPTQELIAALGVSLEIPPSQREGIVAQTLRRRSVWPDRDAAREAWRDKPLFAPWRDEAFTLYLDEGMADLPNGEVRLKCDPTVEAHIFASTGSLGFLDYGPYVQAPVHLVHAKQGFFPFDFYAELAKRFPKCTLLQLDAGHMLPLEAPEAVVELIMKTSVD